MLIVRRGRSYQALRPSLSDNRLLIGLDWRWFPKEDYWESDIEGLYRLSLSLRSPPLDKEAAAALDRYRAVRGKINAEKGGIFAYRGPFPGNTRERLLLAGWTWNEALWRWETGDPRKAMAARIRRTSAAEELLREKFARERAAIAESLAASSGEEFPCPEGLSYLPYQKAGIAFCLKREAVLLADDMGLGKTIQAIGLLNADPSLRRVLLVCPAALKINWARELKRWLVRPMEIGIVEGGFWPFFVEVTVINYDLLHRHAGRLREKPWDLVICDEAHYLKNRAARRTAALFGSSKLPAVEARRKLLLTGTPLMNRPAELWPLLHYLAPSDWPSFSSFSERYCGGREDSRGASNLGELARRLRTTVMIRRRKSDVLKELPPKRRQIVVLPADSLRILVEAEKRAWSDGKTVLAELRAKAKVSKIAGDREAYRAAVAGLRTSFGAFLAQMAKMRHDMAVAIAPLVAAHAEAILGQEEKLVLFAHHQDVVEGLAQRLSRFRPVLAHGGHSAIERQAAVDSFQSDPTVRVFVGSIYAMGTGHTLTAASTVVFGEIDWVPAAISQAEDRLHRIGQANPVLAQHLVVDGSIGALMAEAIVRKQEVIDRAMMDRGAGVRSGLDEDANDLVREVLGFRADREAGGRLVAA